MTWSHSSPAFTLSPSQGEMDASATKNHHHPVFQLIFHPVNIALISHSLQPSGEHLVGAHCKNNYCKTSSPIREHEQCITHLLQACWEEPISESSLGIKTCSSAYRGRLADVFVQRGLFSFQPFTHGHLHTRIFTELIETSLGRRSPVTVGHHLSRCRADVLMPAVSIQKSPTA